MARSAGVQLGAPKTATMKTITRHMRAPALALAALLMAVGTAQAFDPSWRHEAQNRSQDGRDNRSLVNPLLPNVPRAPRDRSPSRARDAVQRGDIRSLEDVAARVQSRYPGRLLDARLDQNGARWVYRLKMLTREGRVLNIAVDARTAQILGVGGRR
jgi:uncharacterized membrane protein YkoI